MSAPPLLQQIFEKLKTGHHISYEDADLHAALMDDDKPYEEFFAAIGLKLIRHPKDFFYFEAQDRETESKQLPKVAVFAYILIDHIASQGRPIEETLMNETFSLRGLPHFSLDSYRAHLRQVAIIEPDELRDVLQYLSRIGWAKWLGVDEFRFLRPFCRVFEKCLELSQLSSNSANAEAIDEETLPKVTGTPETHA